MGVCGWVSACMFVCMFECIHIQLRTYVCTYIHAYIQCINVLKDSLCTAGCVCSGVGPSTLGVYYGVEGTHWICTVSTVQ